MRELSPSEILGVWEHGRGRSLPERALDLLAAAGHDEPPERLAVGERDALLLELRERLLGPSLSAVVTCPSCGEVLELELAAGALRAEPAPSAGPLELEARGGRIRFRVATAADLVAVAGAADREQARALLLERLVTGGGAVPDDDGVAELLAQADPRARIELAVACPACGREWQAPFDIVSFLWAELEAWARRLVRDVHVLASAYGWREAEVLALSAARRAAYLELVEG